MNSSFRNTTATFMVMTLSFASLTACASEKKVSADSASTAPASPAAAGAPPAAAAPVANAPAGTPPPASQDPAAPQQAPVVGQDANAQPNQAPAPLMSNAELVAPIALYPDALLAQVLASATNPQEVLDVGNWLLQNQSLKGDAAVAAAEKAGFTPSVQYLVNFPQVVDQMCQEIDWTTQLGQAFKADPKGVLEAVQIRRREAQKMGNLATTPQMVVNTASDNGQQVIEIKPANPTVVYVPQYNPVTIYTTPAPPPQTVVVQQGVSTGTAVGIGLLSFGVGMAVGAMINRNNYYPYPSWGYGSVYYGGRPYYPPPYRPVYPGYRPAYGYHPPPNYHWNQYNRQTNVTVNNNYYNNFNRNTQINNTQNNRYNQNSNNRPNNQYPNNANRPNNQLPAGSRPGNQNANNRPGGNNQGNLNGQYQGQRPNTTGNQRPGTGMANANPGNTGQRPNTTNRPGNATAGTNRPNTGNPNTMNRPNTGTAGSRPNTGTGNTSRPSNQPSTRPTTQPSARPANQPPSRQPSNMSRPTNGTGAAAARQPATRQTPNNQAQKGGTGGGAKPQGKPQGGKPTGRPQGKPQ